MKKNQSQSPSKIQAKTVSNTNIEDVKAKVSDVKVFGDGDQFKLLCKAFSEKEGWMKSTKAMEVERVGCVVQTTTQQQNKDGSYVIAEAVVFIPGTRIIEILNTKKEVTGRKLIHIA